MICIEIPEEIASSFRLPPVQIELHLKRELAIHLVREGICSAAQGAKLAQMGRLAFEGLLGERRIPWPGNIEDVKSDLKSLDIL